MTADFSVTAFSVTAFFVTAFFVTAFFVTAFFAPAFFVTAFFAPAVSSVLPAFFVAEALAVAVFFFVTEALPTPLVASVVPPTGASSAPAREPVAFFATLFAAAPTAFTALAATSLPEDAAPDATPRACFFPPASLASPPEARAWVERPDADCCTAVFFATMPRPLHIL